MYQLKIMFMSGPDDGLEVEVTSDTAGQPVEGGWEFILGRRENCDIPILFDTQVSREHASLIIRPTGALLSDKNSRNGVLINNRKIKEATEITVETFFRIGHTWLRLQSWSIV